MPGTLSEILISDRANGQMSSKPLAEFITGKGIVGDRYFENIGTFSEKLKGLPDCEVTLIEIEEILSFNKKTNLNYSPSDFRRNLVTSGIRLNNLVDKTFNVGTLQLKGIRLCEPCAHLSSLLGKEVLNQMVHKAGLRAQIIQGGVVKIGEQVG